MTTTILSLSDAQWCVLDLLLRAEQKGVSRLNRAELLANAAVPEHARVALTWAALTMPETLLQWHGTQEFAITEAGRSALHLKFGASAQPTGVGDRIICLPDHSSAARAS